MKVGRYTGNGEVGIFDEPQPTAQAGELLIRTEASGLCSGELMDWYMDKKIPHVLGHEVCGRVISSDNEMFPEGSRVFAHHHAPCLMCDLCRKGLHVHCAQWKTTKLRPGGMAEYFVVPSANLNDTFVVDRLRPIDAALIEPLACVHKSIRISRKTPRPKTFPRKHAVIGLGVMGLMHMLLLRHEQVIGYDLNPKRVAWARGLGLDARPAEPRESADVIFVCPGSEAAIRSATEMAQPGATIVLFAPLPPDEEPRIPVNTLYFNDLNLACSYSCGPNETRSAYDSLLDGVVKAEQVVSDFVSIDELPEAYRAMKRGDILKAMVVFD